MMFIIVLLLAASLYDGKVIRNDVPGPACEPDERYNCNGVTHPMIDPNNCTVFYNCDANIQQPCPNVCPPGLAFDESLQLCNWEDQVAACSTRRSVKADGPACDDSQRYNCNGVTHKVIDPNNCTVFYNCDANIQQPCPNVCPPGLAFDESLQLCNWEDQVAACSTRRSVKADGPACDDSQRYNCNGVTHKVIDPNNCTVFYNCDANIQQPCPNVCPPGLAFDESLQLCNWEDQVAACSTRRSVKADGPACDDSQRYNCNGVTHKVIDPNNCTVFYNCDANIQQPCPNVCPPGLAFDESLQLCNWEDQVAACSTRRSVKADGPACDDSQRYNCNGVTHKVIDPNNCTVFYNCDANIQQPCPNVCPPGLAFDESLQLCNWEDQVAACSTRRSVKADGPACDDSQRYNCNGVTHKVIDPNNCTVFYNCDANIQQPCPNVCPPGLAFDESLQICNWEDQVAACSTRRSVKADGPACDDFERYDCNGVIGMVVDANDCSKFYNCDANIQQPCPSTCPAGLVFDEDQQYCDYEYNVVNCP